LVTSVFVPPDWYFKVIFSHIIVCVAHSKWDNSKIGHAHLNTDQENSSNL
jgi:hypothetical protein